MLKQNLGLVIAACLLLCSCASSINSTQVQKNQSLYDRVIQSGKIRCGYVIYPPSCLKDPNTGKLEGISVEALELVAKKLGLTVEWTEEVGYGTMIEGLKTGRYDMLGTAIWTNAARAKLADFGGPLYYTPMDLYVRKGDKRFTGHWEKINSPSVKITNVDGGTGQIIADEDYPKAGKLSMPQLTDLTQNLLNLAAGKADVSFAEPFTVDRFIRNNPNSIENISVGKPVRIFPNCWMFNRGEFEFKSMLNTVLDEVINSGALDKIIAKYPPAEKLVYRTAMPYKLPK
jgi:polar amino acid transport system substrate-binding protein